MSPRITSSSVAVGKPNSEHAETVRRLFTRFLPCLSPTSSSKSSDVAPLGGLLASTACGRSAKFISSRPIVITESEMLEAGSRFEGVAESFEWPSAHFFKSSLLFIFQ